MISRADQSILTDWWLSVDRQLLALIGLLALSGVLVSLTVTPPAALRMGYDPLYFAEKHALAMVFAGAVLFAVSLLNPRQLRRLALILFSASLALMLAALLQGVEKNGAVRWLTTGGIVLQPSEFAKPGFVVLSAWFMAESIRRPDMPALKLAVFTLTGFCGLLVLQPDMGQAVLLAAIWTALFFLAGHSLKWMPILGAAGASALLAAYATVPHFASRLDRYFGAPGQSIQAEAAAASFRDAQWIGGGFTADLVKTQLPDAHNDYIFAALAGQLGIAACLFLILIYALIVWRVMSAALRESGMFCQLALAGLIMVFGFQALINIAVNLNLLPAKGMTLPLISYGRSSLLSSAITLGMILSLTRRWPGACSYPALMAGLRGDAMPVWGNKAVTNGSIMLAAGGTGGHLFPAQALGEELIRRGYDVDLMTDTRGGVFGSEFPARNVFKIPAATFRGKSPIEATRTVATLGNGFQVAYKIMGEAQPKAIIGFGGYPTLAPLLAALGRGIPSAIHEQNAVMGQANRFLAPMVKAIACSFEQTKFLEGKLLSKARLTGTPLRQAVLELASVSYRPPASQGQLNLLVFGGSQGAQYFSDVMPKALQMLPEPVRDRLFVMQQCREDDIDRVFDAYEAAGVAAELATFFEDMPQRMSNAHLVVARAGATTVAELCALGRPAILVPLPHSKDNDQLENALRLEGAGGAWCYQQSALTAERLAGAIGRLFDEPSALTRAASNAQALASYGAVEYLADLLGELAERPRNSESLAATA